MKPLHFTPEQIADIGQRVAAGETPDAVGVAYSCDRKVILRLVRKHKLGPWKSRTNVPQQTRRPPPEDFAKLNETMSDNALSRHYRCGGGTPAQWRRELGIKPKTRAQGGRNRVDTPADFATFAPGKSLEALAFHYGIGTEVIRRMRAEHGIVGMPVGFQRNPAKPAHLVRNAYMSTPIDRTVRDSTRGGMAAEYLRRDAPVYRCGPLGAADAQGSHWRYGRVVLTDAELIERAERKGWTPDAWEKVA